MNNNNVPLDYANSLMYELEKAFWDERGKGARFRMTKVGYQYFDEKVRPLLQSTEVEDILEKIAGVLQRRRDCCQCLLQQGRALAESKR